MAINAVSLKEGSVDDIRHKTAIQVVESTVFKSIAVLKLISKKEAAV